MSKPLISVVIALCVVLASHRISSRCAGMLAPFKKRKGCSGWSRDLACLHDDVLLVALAFLTGAEVSRFAKVSRAPSFPILTRCTAVATHAPTRARPSVVARAGGERISAQQHYAPHERVRLERPVAQQNGAATACSRAHARPQRSPT